MYEKKKMWIYCVNSFHTQIMLQFISSLRMSSDYGMHYFSRLCFNFIIFILSYHSDILVIEVSRLFLWFTGHYWGIALSMINDHSRSRFAAQDSRLLFWLYLVTFSASCLYHDIGFVIAYHGLSFTSFPYLLLYLLWFLWKRKVKLLELSCLLRF